MDSKIKKAESEIPAMENTLRVISASNDCYKRNLDSIDADSTVLKFDSTVEYLLPDHYRTKLLKRSVNMRSTKESHFQWKLIN